MGIKSHSFLASLICFFLCLPASAQSQADHPVNLEQRLRLRCDGLYTAIRDSKWKTAESFLNEDAKVIWLGMKKGAIYGFEISSVTVAADGKTGKTETIVESAMRMPGFTPIKVKNPQTVEWAWENNDWYALLRERVEVPTPAMGPDGVPKVATPPQEPAGPAELVFTKRIYDFRSIRKGETIHAKFYFTNKSDHVVKVRGGIFNSCQCATIKISQDEFKPGEEGWVEATMETAEFGGYIEQGMDVYLQPSRARVTLQMRGVVLMPGQNPQDK